MWHKFNLPFQHIIPDLKASSFIYTSCCCFIDRAHKDMFVLHCAWTRAGLLQQILRPRRQISLTLIGFLCLNCDSHTLTHINAHSGGCFSAFVMAWVMKQLWLCGIIDARWAERDQGQERWVRVSARVHVIDRRGKYQVWTHINHTESHYDSNQL